MMTDTEILDDFFKKTDQMVIAVILPDGKPWAVPVHIQHREGYQIFEWDSKPEAVHSKAIESNPNIAITMSYMNTGFYAQAKVEAVRGVADDEQQVRYKAVVGRCWLNDNFFKREIAL